MLIELIHAQSWSGLFGVANNHSDSTNPHGERSESELLQKVGQMRIVVLLCGLVDLESRVVDALLAVEEALESLKRGSPFGSLRLLNVLENHSAAPKNQVVHHETRFFALHEAAVAEEVRHAVQTDICSVEVIGHRMANIIALVKH